VSENKRLSTRTAGIRGEKGKRYTGGGRRLAAVDMGKAITLGSTSQGGREKVKVATTPRSVMPIRVESIVATVSQKSSMFVKNREVAVRER